ncbi:hypothetical protein SGLAM104S_10020 [Streptomyces glaucescens]
MTTPPWGAMARLAGRRALFAGPVLLAVTFGVFAIAAASPFDPVKAYAGTAALGADQETLDRLRANLGVDEPFWVRWWDWVTAAEAVGGGDVGEARRCRGGLVTEAARRPRPGSGPAPARSRCRSRAVVMGRRGGGIAGAGPRPARGPGRQAPVASRCAGRSVRFALHARRTPDRRRDRRPLRGGGR